MNSNSVFTNWNTNKLWPFVPKMPAKTNSYSSCSEKSNWTRNCRRQRSKTKDSSNCSNLLQPQKVSKRGHRLSKVTIKEIWPVWRSGWQHRAEFGGPCQKLGVLNCRHIVPEVFWYMLNYICFIVFECRNRRGKRRQNGIQMPSSPGTKVIFCPTTNPTFRMCGPATSTKRWRSWPDWFSVTPLSPW